MGLQEAIAQIVPERCRELAVGGMHMHNNPMALIREIIRQNKRITRLTTSPSGSINADLLIGSGLVDEVMTSYIGLEHLGLALNYRRAVEQKTIRLYECDEPMIVYGLQAGAGGWPFVPYPRGLELSDLPKVNPEMYRFTTDPYTGQKIMTAPPIRPEVAVVHCLEADEQGNARMAGSVFTDRHMIFAAERVILQVERVVKRLGTPEDARSFDIPGFLVAAVVVAPGGCHPTSAHSAYGYDEGHLKSYLKASKTEDSFRAYIDEVILPPEESYRQRFPVAGAAVTEITEPPVSTKSGATAETVTSSVTAVAGVADGEEDGTYTMAELMGAVMARHLRDGEVAVMGAVSMIPMVACRMAQFTHAPNLNYIAGGSGAVNPHLEPLVPSSCDYGQLKADAVLPLPDVILLEGRFGRLDVFFAGGLQIDQYGNCNLVCVGDYEQPKMKGPGTVGLPFLPLAGRVIIYTMAHNARTLVPKVDFNSGPGFLSGPEAHEAAQMPGQGPALVVTPLCVFDFDETSKVMRIRSLHPGVTLEQVLENTGFTPVIPDEIPVTPVPTLEELAGLRRADPTSVARKLL